MASEVKETSSSTQVCTLVVVAKYPAPGKAKTRLARSVGDTTAAKISEAMLCDVLQRLDLAPNVRKVLLFAPESKQEWFSQTLQSLNLASEWTLQRMLTQDTRASDLGSILSSAVDTVRENCPQPTSVDTVREKCPQPTSVDTVRENCPQPTSVDTVRANCPQPTSVDTVRENCPQPTSVVFVGSDCVELDASLIGRVAAICRSGRAYVCPATDGGYVLLGLPCDSPSSVFNNVLWSSEETLKSQCAALHREGVNYEVGETFSDVDEVEDLLALTKRISSSVSDYPHLAPYLPQVD